jgi:serine/threonine-protein kinase
MWRLASADGGRAVILLVAALAAALTGCSTPRLPTSSATTSSASTTAVAPDRLDSILLTVAEANTVMSTSSMQISVPIYHGTYTKNVPTMRSNPDCLSASGPALDPVYVGSGYSAVSTETMLGSDSHGLTQAVASFPTAESARAFVENLANKWKVCAGQTITAETIPAPYGIYSEQTYSVGSFDSDLPTIALSTSSGRGDCQRALRAVSNIVIDVEACASPLDDQGRHVADQIMAKAE